MPTLEKESQAPEKDSTLDYLFPIDSVPSRINNIELSLTNRQRLAKGQYSSLLTNIDTKDGIQDAKVKLIPKDNGRGFEYSIQYKSEQLAIPKKIGRKKLNPQQEQELKEGKPILFKKGYYLKLDSELNTVTVQSDRDFNIPHKIGGYTLSDSDKLSLAKGESMPQRLLEKNGNYYLAKINLTFDKHNNPKGIEFSGIRSVTAEWAKEHRAEINSSKELPNAVKDFADIGSDSIDASKEKELTKGIETESADRLIEHGAAPYQNDKENDQSYFVTVEKQDGTIHTHWGKDLERAITEAGAKEGDKISVENKRKQPVTIEHPIKDEKGKITGHENIETHRNEWNITKTTPKEHSKAETIVRDQAQKVSTKNPDLLAIRNQMDVDINKLAQYSKELSANIFTAEGTSTKAEKTINAIADFASRIDIMERVTDIIDTAGPLLNDKQIQDLKTGIEKGDRNAISTIENSLTPMREKQFESFKNSIDQLKPLASNSKTLQRYIDNKLQAIGNESINGKDRRIFKDPETSKLLIEGKGKDSLIPINKQIKEKLASKSQSDQTQEKGKQAAKNKVKIKTSKGQDISM